MDVVDFDHAGSLIGAAWDSDSGGEMTWAAGPRPRWPLARPFLQLRLALMARRWRVR